MHTLPLTNGRATAANQPALVRMRTQLPPLASQPDDHTAAWPFPRLDPVQYRNHLAAQAAVQRIAEQQHRARVADAQIAWRKAGGA